MGLQTDPRIAIVIVAKVVHCETHIAEEQNAQGGDAGKAVRQLRKVLFDKVRDV